MLLDAATFIIRTLAELFAGVLLLRFWMQVCRVGGRNPLSEFVQTLTNFAVLPVRRIVPGLWGLDLTTLVLAWLTLILEIVLLLLLRDGALAPGTVLLMALLLLLRLAVYFAIGAIFMQVILSWVNPSSPFAPVIAALTRPLLRPIQRIVPPIGRVDLSSLVALLILQLILMVPLAWLGNLIHMGF